MIEPGREFAQFKIVKKLGEGGMGEVYLAEDQKLNRQVAIKTLRSDVFGEAERRQRFEREARTAAQINHSNVTAIYDISHIEIDGQQTYYIVMEYVRGRRLFDYLTKDVDMKQTIAAAEGIASGLAAAHKLNIVHRDIKADNVMVDEDGSPKILDFGLAKPIDQVQLGDKEDQTNTLSQELTRAGKILGTVSYMSPEQAKGESVDTRSDIFSYGILLYRMVTREMPFAGNTNVSTLAKILESQHDAPSTKNKNIPPELERIINKCLRKDPNDRYQDTRDLLVDLRNLRRQFDSGVSDSVSGISDVARSRSSSAKLSQPRTLFGIAAVVVIAAVGYWMWGGSGGGLTSTANAAEASLAILTFENKTGDASLDWLETGLPEILITDLAQNSALTVISRERVLDCLPRDKRDNHTLQECIKAAGSIGAGSVLSGTFYKLGDKIRIDARVEDIKTGKILMGEKVIGDDPFTLVDSLTAKIAISLNVEEKGVQNASVASLTSASPAAYKAYIEGMSAFQAALMKEAEAKFHEAIEIDSTFALAYMRIAMVKNFQGRQQEGMPYFLKAKQYEQKLPPRERLLLDTYADIWLNNNFDDAFAKMGVFVNNYPEDKEGRAIYGILINVFQKDTAAAYAQLDTALAIDPFFQVALSMYAEVASSNRDYDKAIHWARKIQEYHPHSPEGYSMLGRFYQHEGRIDDAIEQYRHLADDFPDNPEAFSNLSDLYILRRDFKMARTYLDKFKERHGSDPVHLRSYYHSLANLENWKGKFYNGLDNRHRALQQSLSIGDSIRIQVDYQSLMAYYQRFDMIDSALYFAQQSFRYASGMRKLNYPMTLIELRPEAVGEARPIFANAIEEFRKRLPSEMWPLADQLEGIFESSVRHDTLSLIEAFEGLIAYQTGDQEGNRRALARLLVEVGRFGEAKPMLEEIVAKESSSPNAYTYLEAKYYLGRINEGLGNEKEAIANYREVLSFWKDADIEIEPLTDSRKRLEKLAS